MEGRCISDAADRRPVAAAALAFGAAAAIGVAAALGWTAGFDGALLVAMAVDPDSAWGRTMAALTWAGDAERRLAVTGVVLIAWIALRRRRDALVLALLVLSGSAFVSLAKAAIARPRPDLLPHLDVVESASFPSGHSANNMILWLAIALMLRAPPVVTLLLLIPPLAIGVSRVALGVHWPSDVLAGWLIGVGWVMVGVAVGRRNSEAVP